MFGRSGGTRDTPSIESMPTWAFFRCLAGGNAVGTRRTSKTRLCGHGLDVREVRRCRRRAEHRKQAHLGIFSMFGRWGCCGDAPNIKNMPMWAWSRCSGDREVVDTHRVRRCWRHTKHRKHAHLGMTSVFGRWGGGGHTPNIENMLRWHVFVVWRVETW